MEELERPHMTSEPRFQRPPKTRPPRKKLDAIEGIGEAYAAKLKAAGAASTATLLKAGATGAGRKDLAEKTGISQALILEWANRANLFRIKGIGEEYSDLLEAAGVDTVDELSRRDPQNLYEKMVAANQEKRLVRKLPSEEQVASWIVQAKSLPRVIEY